MENSEKIDFEVGFFQKNLIETKNVELLFKKYGVSKKLYSILSKYCECKEMKLSIFKNLI